MVIIKDLPHVTVGQVLALRKAVIELEEELAITKQARTAYRISLENLEASLPKIKADAFQQGVKAARCVVDDVDADIKWGYDGYCGVFDKINNSLDKLEAGE